ncbi:hypothetical protein DyAD56_15305 [Dyella sp. AD56]|uniref:hypothetical protein n=1 Tax=Dyella sp. AD56 TaxID=1528744 RepID=UPI000C85E33B|nr:hypothetical protein [Dyella sp. AD56]PMQ04367.1 hypothetical protein DyAD56_15305 [Dyella sp. AD56]
MTWKAITLGVVLVGLLVTIVALVARPDVPDPGTDKAVLSAVVSLQCQGKGRGKVLLSAKPIGPRDLHIWIPQDISMDQGNALAKRADETKALPAGIECPRVSMVSYARLKAAFDQPAKQPMELPVPAGIRIPIGMNTGFQDAFPDIELLLRLSMPIYSRTQNTAVVYFEEDCGGLCAHGEYVVVERLDGVWRVTKRLQAWTS